VIDQNARIDLRPIARQAMLDSGLEPDFPPDVMQQLRAIGGPAREAEPSIRDLRSLLWCSIDNDDSLDLDQLTVAEQVSPSTVKVLVAIADVDALVKNGSPIDRHASQNTTSVYTAAAIFPMLPERLSTDLTSLSQDQDRLAVVIEMVVASDGSIQDSSVYRALVRNQAKLAYSSVASWLDGEAEVPARVAKVAGLDEQLRLQDQVAQSMRTVRYQHGALDLELIEPEAVLSAGKIVDLRQAKQNRAQKLIEDFMIAANTVASTFLVKRGWPSVRRIVRSPERWDRIQKVAEGFHEQLPAEPDSQALSAFLAHRRQADPLRFPDLSLTIVKLLGAGEYVVQLPGQNSPGHFGLAVRGYSHSTAPNRRFADLVTQRLLKTAVVADQLPYTSDELAALATHCTQQEDKARKVERRVRKSAAALFLAGRIGEEFDAIVTGASDKGTWVRLLKPPVEGKLTRGEAGAAVGDRVRVRLANLNVQQGFIDFVRLS
jgi:exoribonuclease-2